MEPWLHLVPGILTIRRLGSPLVPFRANPEDRLDAVVDRVAEYLRDNRTGPERPSLTRAAILLDDGSGAAILDSFLDDPLWLNDLRSDPVGISSIAIPVDSSLSLTPETGVLEAMEMLADATPPLAGWQPVAPPPLIWITDDAAHIGVMAEQHFHSVPVRLAVLCFLLELEGAIVDRARKVPSAWARIASLRRSGKVYFGDALHVAYVEGWCWSGRDPVAAAEASKRLRDIRNWCAHVEGSPFKAGWILQAVHEAREVLLAVQAGLA